MKGKLFKYLALFCLFGCLTAGTVACNFGDVQGGSQHSAPSVTDADTEADKDGDGNEETDEESDEESDDEEETETDEDIDTEENPDTEENSDTDENPDTDEDTDTDEEDGGDEVVGVAFVENGETEYQLVVGEGQAEEAAAFIAMHVEYATGATLSIAEETQWSEEAKYIVLGDKALAEEAGVYYDWAQLGTTGYYIKTAGNSAFITANSAEGYQLGAIAFLYATVGYDLLTADCIVYEKDGTILPQTDIVGYPDFAVRLGLNGKPSDNGYGMGYTQTDYYGFIPVDGYPLHNTSKYLPAPTYLADHPEWYAMGSMFNTPQLCYTACGDEASKDEMQETILSKMVSAIEAYPDMEYIGLFQEDTIVYCTCAACTELKTQYGSYSGVVIRFINELDDKLQEYLWEKASETGEEKREIKLVFMGYTFTEQPPVTKDDDGQYIAVDETVKCNESVCVLLCPVQAKYTHGFTEEENAEYAENIKAWTAVCKHILVWTYQANFTQFLYPYASWTAASDTYAFLKDMGVEYIYNQGQYRNEVATGFGYLKNYLNGKLGLNAEADTEELTDKWFTYYFLDAAEPMKEYFDGLEAYCAETARVNGLTGSIHENIAKTSYWDYDKLNEWIGLIDEAYEAIAEYETSDPALYGALKKRIDIESLFPRYALCSLYYLRYEDAVLEEMRSAFLSDCLALGFYYMNENTSIKVLFSDWGYSADENNWENGALYLNGWLLQTDTALVSGEYTVKAGTKAIFDSAFTGCRDLTSITIPDSVTSIGINAFMGCGNLTSITFNGTVEEWGAIEKGERWNLYVRATEVVCSNGTAVV